MSKADVLQLVSDISLGQADATLSSGYYDDVIDELGEKEILTQLSIVEVTGGTAVYSIPATAIRLFGAFYNERHLNELMLREVESYSGINWRDEKGPDVVGYLTESEDEGNFRLFPVPDESNDALSFANGVPFGL